MFKQNDIVWHGQSRLTRYECGPTWEYRHLTCGEAFELAGVGVDGPLAINDYDWWYSDGKLFDVDRPGEWCAEDYALCEVDLSRLPVSDCWDVLPQVVREAVEKKLEDQ